MMTRTRFLLIASLLACGGGAHAGSDCGNPVTSAEVAECTDRESSAIEQKLNAVYSQVLMGLGRVDKEYGHSSPNRPALHAAESFAAAQRAWLNFRRQSCHVENLVVLNGNPGRGDQPAIAVAACESRLSSARVTELRNLASSYDISISEDSKPSLMQTSSNVSGDTSSPSVPERIVSVRGQQALTEELILPPDATDLWRRIQALIANPDWMVDFATTVKALNLTVVDPPKGAELRPDFHYNAEDHTYYAIQQFGLGVSRDAEDSPAQRLSFRLDPNAICISPQEVRRVYGSGEIGVPSHGGVPKAYVENPTGAIFSEAYGEPVRKRYGWPVVFSYGRSGCLDGVTLLRRLPPGAAKK